MSELTFPFDINGFYIHLPAGAEVPEERSFLLTIRGITSKKLALSEALNEQYKYLNFDDNRQIYIPCEMPVRSFHAAVRPWGKSHSGPRSLTVEISASGYAGPKLKKTEVVYELSC